MRRALLKTVFLAAVALLTIALLIPASLLLDAIFPTTMQGPDGQLHGGDRLLPGIVVIVLSIALANRMVSSLFWAGRLSDERWSVFDHRPRRRSGSRAA
jgi:hypothetical protein